MLILGHFSLTRGYLNARKTGGAEFAAILDTHLRDRCSGMEPTTTQRRLETMSNPIFEA